MSFLYTERLTLRPIRLSDAKDIFGVRGDSEAMRFWDWPADKNLAATELVVARLAEEVALGGSIYCVARTHLEKFVGLHDLSNLALARLTLDSWFHVHLGAKAMELRRRKRWCWKVGAADLLD